ncbi:MAG: sugar phosphate isomerase/epimerase family protein [Ruthenibacterium sp.]
MASFKIGVRGHDFSQNTPAELFSTIAKNGFHSVQLAPKKSFNLSDISQLDVHEAKHALLVNGVEISVYGCYVEIAMLDERIRKKALDEYLKAMPIAKALNSGCIACETTDFTLQPFADRTQAFDVLCKSLESILKIAEDIDLIACIEPVFTHTINTPQMTKKLLDTMSSKKLGIIFDPVNLLSNCTIQHQNSLWDNCINSFGEYIKAVHIKGTRVDANGNLTECSLIDSQVNYAYIFEKLKQLNGEIPVLREGIDQNQTKEDKAFINKFIL